MSGFITLPTDDWVRLVEKVQKAGLKAKPEVGIQFGAGGASRAEELEAEGIRDAGWAIQQAKRFLDAGAYMIMVESEGITSPSAPVSGAQRTYGDGSLPIKDDSLVKSIDNGRLRKKLHMQGAQILRNEAYLWLRRNDEGCSATPHDPLHLLRSNGCPAFYEAVKDKEDRIDNLIMQPGGELN